MPVASSFIFLALDTVAALLAAALGGLLPQRREKKVWERYQRTPVRSEHQHGSSRTLIELREHNCQSSSLTYI